MSNSKLKEQTISGLFWQFSQKWAAQFVSFSVSVILARVLLPEDFGVVALAGMFTTFFSLFVGCGMGTALIQKKDADNLDYCTIFWAQMLFSTIIYIIVFILAPWFSLLSPQLTSVIRVSALTMIIGTIGGIQGVIVTRQMAFKIYFYRTLVASVFSGFIGIILALRGWGVWALVAQHMSSTIIGIIAVFSQVRWIPRFVFSVERFKSMFGVGVKFMTSGLIGTVFNQLKGYMVGLKYTTADLAYYNRGEGIPHLFTQNIDASINSVLFPVFSKLQNDRLAVRSAVRRSIKTSSFLIFPIVLGLAAIAENLVVLLYTEKWIPCIPFMQLFCISECFTILNTANLQVLRGIGEVNTLLKMELYKKPILIAILAVTVFISPLAIAMGMVLYGIYTMFVNAFPNRKFIHYHIKDQIKDVGDNALLSIFMAVCVFLIGFLDINPYILVTIQVIVGIVIYMGISQLLHVESWEYVKAYAKPYFHKIKGGR